VLIGVYKKNAASHALVCLINFVVSVFFFRLVDPFYDTVYLSLKTPDSSDLLHVPVSPIDGFVKINDIKWDHHAVSEWKTAVHKPGSYEMVVSIKDNQDVPKVKIPFDTCVGATSAWTVNWEKERDVIPTFAADSEFPEIIASFVDQCGNSTPCPSPLGAITVSVSKCEVSDVQPENLDLHAASVVLKKIKFKSEVHQLAQMSKKDGSALVTIIVHHLAFGVQQLKAKVTAGLPSFMRVVDPDEDFEVSNLSILPPIRVKVLDSLGNQILSGHTLTLRLCEGDGYTAKLDRGFAVFREIKADFTEALTDPENNYKAQVSERPRDIIMAHVSFVL